MSGADPKALAAMVPDVRADGMGRLYVDQDVAALARKLARAEGVLISTLLLDMLNQRITEKHPEWQNDGRKSKR